MLVEIALAILLMFLLITWMNKDPAGLPPGPKAIPFLGSSKLLKTPECYERLRDEYGDIVRTSIGSMNNVVIFNYKIAREVFNKTETAERPQWRALQFLADGKWGLVFSNGERWVKMRRFFLRNLRDMGMGKSYLSQAIIEEAKGLAEDFNKYTDRPTELPTSIKLAVLNIIWQLVASQRYSLDDQKILNFMELMKKYQKNMMFMMLPELFPLLNLLPSGLKDRIFMFNWLKETACEGKKPMTEAIEEHRMSLDPDNPRDVIDAYLLEMRENKNSDSFFTEDGLLREIFDLFAAGFDTTATAISWVCLYMAAHPDIQKKVQQQIDDVVGSDDSPSLEHKPRLPYLEATLTEILRLRPVTISGVPHVAATDITIEGYHIPKGFCVTACISAIHTDPRYWKNPKEFCPDRFIDESGHFSVPKEGFLPFSVGKRSCLGESLARMELYLFAATLLQRFFFAPPEGCKIDLECMIIPGNIKPKPQNVVITARK